MLAILLFATALANEPHRCEAVFSGPAQECDLPGDWSTTGTGKTESLATKAAKKRLEELVLYAAEDRALRAAGTLAEAMIQVDRCAEVAAAKARVICFAEPDLAPKRMCFATFKDDKCWRGGLPIDVEGPAWKAMEMGRDQLCQSMLASLTEAGASEGEKITCQLRCLQQTSVRCMDLGDE